jgi:glycosyltransferase involved in cell wall biosynthesis
VLWLIKGLGLGGAERIVVMSAPALQRRGWQVEVAYVRPDKDAWVPALVEAGVTTHCLGEPGPVPGGRWPLELQRLLRARRYQVIHSHSPVAATVARALPGGRGSVFVHTEHNVWPRFRLPVRVLNTATIGRNRRLFAVSDAVARSMKPTRWEPWARVPAPEVLYHGIDESEVRTGSEARAKGRADLGVPPHAFVIATVGNLVPKKDHHTLLDAFATAFAQHPDTHLVIIGGGPLEAELRARAATLGVAERVLFTGQRPGVADLYGAFDLFVLSSLHEGLPLALLEAMASELPVIATSVGGIPEVVTDGRDGLLVSPRDPGALADAMRSIARDEETAARLAAAARVTAGRFSIPRAVDRMAAVYTDVLST